MLSICPSKTGFKKMLMIMDASALYNVHGGAPCCQCKEDCATNKRCMCRKLGQLCASKCHKGRGGNNTCNNMHSDETCKESETEAMGP